MDGKTPPRTRRTSAAGAKASTSGTKASRGKAARPKAAPAATGGGKSARTRERILDAAAHTLSLRGYAGTRLADIAEYAEIQAPAIYYYFPSREDLIEEVMYTGVSRLRETVEAALEALPDGTAPLKRLCLAIETHLRYSLEVSDYTASALRNSTGMPEELRERYDAEALAYGEIWKRLVEGAASEGALRKDVNTTHARMLILGALNWATEWWAPDRGRVDDLVATAQDLVLNGLAARRQTR
jgi:AcrR family transcriptional regulator